MLTVLGPSGCGKTTVLRLIAGLDDPDAGTIEIGGRRVAGGGSHRPARAPPGRDGLPGRRAVPAPVGPRQHRLRAAPGPRPRGSDRRAARAHRPRPRPARRMPHELSGGMQQRVAVARALAPRPDVVLLDEPFSSLDATLRTQLRGDVREILRAAGTAAIFVTHDQDEATDDRRSHGRHVPRPDRAVRATGGRLRRTRDTVRGHVRRGLEPRSRGLSRGSGRHATWDRPAHRWASAEGCGGGWPDRHPAGAPRDRGGTGRSRRTADPGGSSAGASPAPRSCTRLRRRTAIGCGSRPATPSVDCESAIPFGSISEMWRRLVFRTEPRWLPSTPTSVPLGHP